MKTPMAKTITPEQYARRVAESDPCHATDGYGDPCCAECAAEVTWSAGAMRCVHDDGCDWVLLRRYYALVVPVTINGRLHSTHAEGS